MKIADASIEAAKIKSINADTITAGTIKTDRLIITGPDGEDSIVKAINLANGVSEADVNSQKIQAASIDVIDLSAFKAKIAGFDMNGDAIYSGKESIKDPTSGIYISTTGIGMGDGALTGKNESPLQAYADGSFKLIGKNSFFDFNTVTGELNIEASSFKVASKSVATKDDIDDVRDEITTFLSIESSKGTAFKNNSVSTILSVIIYHGKDRVEDPERMREVFGFSAYLQWYWQRLDDEVYGVISSTDSRLRNEGATGNGISKADITYAASSSNTSAPTSGWQSTPPSVNPGQYLWTKTVFTYTNGGTATQYSVAKQGNTGAAGADAITVSITSSNGTVFKNNSGSTVLTAHVYKGAVEQTVADNGTVSGLGTIKWYTVGSDTAVATAKTLTVSANDVDNTQAYTCQLEG